MLHHRRLTDLQSWSSHQNWYRNWTQWRIGSTSWLFKQKSHWQYASFILTRYQWRTVCIVRIYTDIIENQRVGDVSAPLLRIVPTKPMKAGLVVTHSYQMPHYMPVKTNYIDTIQMDMRSEFGEKVPFQSGKVVVKLHFRCTRKQTFLF